MIEGATVLVVDDNTAIRNLFERVLGPEGVTVLTAETLEAGKEHLSRTPVDMLFLDLFLPDGNGMELLYAVKKNTPDLPVVIITGHGTIERAVEAIKAGAFDFLKKPLEHVDLIRITAEKAMDQRKMLRENWDLKQALSSRYRMDRLVGKSTAMQRIFKTVGQLSENEATVLIHGESGTGKELLAQSIHYNSPRRQMKFVPVDCGSLPETLIESELFGHVKGAYTGAYRDVKGLFREAEGGTIFLDEIGELPVHVQSKLLRTLQEREVRPVGAAKAVSVNVRVIAASHRDLKSAAAAGRFREDLFYRLNVVYLEIPPLRERREDIPLLVDHFLEEHAQRSGKGHTFTPEAMQALLKHGWPGNVRELQNLVEHVLAFAANKELGAADLPALGDGGDGREAVPDVPLSFDAYEKLAIERALLETRHDVDKAARLLDVGLSTFYRKMKKHKIPPPRSTRERDRRVDKETAPGAESVPDGGKQSAIP